MQKNAQDHKLIQTNSHECKKAHQRTTHTGNLTGNGVLAVVSELVTTYNNIDGQNICYTYQYIFLVVSYRYLLSKLYSVCHKQKRHLLVSYRYLFLNLINNSSSYNKGNHNRDRGLDTWP